MLVSGKPIKRPKVILLGSFPDDAKMLELVHELIRGIESGLKVVGKFLHGEDVRWRGTQPPDFGIVFGGDGSILRAARQMGSSQIPVLGLNLGKLGFMADVQPIHLSNALASIEKGDFRLIDHLMLDCVVFRGGGETHRVMALNEVAILGGPPFRIQEIGLYVDGQLAASYNCDGLIISTPVGSTAHNLSAGGPIVRKDLSAVVISPISPHTLTVRPVVDSADRIYELAPVQTNESAMVVVDGDVVCQFDSTHRVRITRAAQSFRMIEVGTNNYYQTLREKLGWSVGFSPNPARKRTYKRQK